MTPTQRAAMELALDALELNCASQTESPATKAMQALRAALAEQPAEPVAWVGLSEDDKLEILRTNGEAAVMYLTEAKLREKNAEQQSAKHGEPVANIGCLGMPVNTPVTAPQPAKRVPLTNGQRESVFRVANEAMDSDHNLSWRHAIVNAVEAAHGIKGETE